MLLPHVLFLLSALVVAQRSQAVKTPDREMLRNNAYSKDVEWFGEGLLKIADTLLPVSKSCESAEESRHKKLKLNKYVLPLIVGFLLIKSILLPIALKALAVLSGKAVVLSLMSLILAAIVGLKKVAQKDGGHYEVINKYRRQDMHDFVNDVALELEPYRFYKERRRKK